jgi:signal transduction histidine kinase
MIAQVDLQLEQYLELVGYVTNIYNDELEGGGELSEPLRPEMFERGGDRHLPIVVNTRPGDPLPTVMNIWMGDTLLAVLEGSPSFGRPGAEGFAYRDTGDPVRHWRILARYDERTQLWLLVGVDVGAARWEMLRTFGRGLLPLLVILPLTAALLYFGVGRGLKPVRALADQIARRTQGALDPVPEDDVPVELKPVVEALNALLLRLARTLDNEQRFTANAAHELLTPLTAIKTEVQLCQRQLTDGAGRDMLGRIALRVDRAGHTVQQLLTLSRLDPDAPLAGEWLDLRELLRDALAETAHIGAERGLQVAFPEGGEMPLHGNREALGILLRNLLVNAFRYGREGSTVRVALKAGGAGPELEIGNDCEPLPPAALSRVGERFYRVPGSAGLGAGLGLSIVDRIAAHHGAQFSVSAGADGSGFVASLRFSASAWRRTP